MLGPLASKAQQDGCATTSARASRKAPPSSPAAPSIPEGFEKGYFVQPTVFANVTNDMTIAQEEIFGPVLSIIGYEDEDDAVAHRQRLDLRTRRRRVLGRPRAGQAVALRMRTGQVDVNGGSFNPVAPFGGYKQSGVGRELGKYGFEEFLEVKSLQL
jgi:aldehyde dehydrogenase (NAD+)